VKSAIPTIVKSFKGLGLSWSNAGINISVLNKRKVVLLVSAFSDGISNSSSNIGIFRPGDGSPSIVRVYVFYVFFENPKKRVRLFLKRYFKEHKKT